MHKIPTLLVRDTDDFRYVTDDLMPGCEWVLAGEGVATRKYDGTCVMFDGERWWARREVKPDKAEPPEFQLVTYDELTGKSFGWEPIEQSGFHKAHKKALQYVPEISPEFDAQPLVFLPGTYELIGPKVNGNPENVAAHMLIRHADAQKLETPRHADGITICVECVKTLVRQVGDRGWEGVVFHHPDGRMAKLKVRDLPPA